MTRQGLAIVAAAFVFAGVALWLRRTGSALESENNSRVSETDRASAELFWRRYRTATNLRQAGDYAGAAESYRDALEIDPDHENSLYYFGNVNLELKNPVVALDSWRRLLLVNPASSRAHLQIGKLRTCPLFPETFDIDSAKSAFTSATMLNREETAPYVWLSEVAMLEEDYAAADTLLQAAIATNHNAPGARLLAAFLQWETGNRESATDQLHTIMSQQNTNTTAGGEGETKTGAAMVIEALVCEGLAADAKRVVDNASVAENPARVFQTLDSLLRSVSRQVRSVSR